MWRKKMKEHKFEDLLQDALKNDIFRTEYEALEEEFQLAEEVIRLRAGKNMSQKELANRVGTSQPTIARLESGKYKNVSLSFLRRIGKALDVVPEVHFKTVEIR
jgi:DNA-binding Xre family transcriptional regulator